jgi:hypothetical protein
MGFERGFGCSGAGSLGYVSSRLISALANRAVFLFAAEGSQRLARARPSIAARAYSAWTLGDALTFIAMVVARILSGRGPGGRLVSLDPCWRPTGYPPMLRLATELWSQEIRARDEHL